MLAIAQGRSIAQMSPQITTIGGYRQGATPDPPFGQHPLDLMMLHGGLTPRTFAGSTQLRV